MEQKLQIAKRQVAIESAKKAEDERQRALATLRHKQIPQNTWPDERATSYSTWQST